MKILLLISIFTLSIAAHSATVMGPEAVEMFEVLTHPNVQKCTGALGLNLVNVKIEKQVYRCLGCMSYTISGNQLNIDVPSTEKTVVKVVGSMVTGAFGNPIQTYDCAH